MKKIFGLMLTAAALAAVGCTTTSEKTWTADQPPPLVSDDTRPTEVPKVKLSSSTRPPVSADEITDENVQDYVRRLQAEIDEGHRSAMSKPAGR